MLNVCVIFYHTRSHINNIMLKTVTIPFFIVYEIAVHYFTNLVNIKMVYLIWKWLRIKSVSHLRLLTPPDNSYISDN